MDSPTRSEVPNTGLEVSIDPILENLAVALGGRPAWQKITSRIIRGAIENPERKVNGAVEIYAQIPNLYASYMYWKGRDFFHSGYNGAVGWFSAPGGSGTFEGINLARLIAFGDFYRDLRVRELYSHVAFKGMDQIQGWRTYALEVAPPGGGVELWHLDRKTGLVVHKQYAVEGPDGKVPFEIYFEDYRDVDGVKIPWRQLRTRPSRLVTTFEHVEHNIPIHPSVFDPPAG